MRVIYPGTFCPPTRGHLAVAQAAAETFGRLTIVCSRNPDKASSVWAGPERCVELWQSYDLPRNVEVVTLDDLLKTHTDEQVVIVRGLRSLRDLAEEAMVIEHNLREFGVRQYHYVCADPKSAIGNISSSLVRALAIELDFQTLARMVSPQCISMLLERALQVRNVVLVAGRPGCGKSTLLAELALVNPRAHIIRTDDWSRKLQQTLHDHFRTDNLIPVLLEREDEVERLLANPWFSELRERLRQAPPENDVFIEIGYALRPRKAMYRFLGGKVLLAHCNETTAQERRSGRGTPQHEALAREIPDLAESDRIAGAQNLTLLTFDTTGPIESLRQKALRLSEYLDSGLITKQGVTPWRA